MIFNYILLLKHQIQVKVDVSESTLTLFLRYLYGAKVDVEEEDIHPITLMELHSLAFQFEQEELKLAARRRFRYLLSQEAWASLHTVDLRNEMARHNMLEIVHLVKVEPHPHSPLSVPIAGRAPIPAIVDPSSPEEQIMEGNHSVYSTYVPLIKNARREVTKMCKKVADLEFQEQV